MRMFKPFRRFTDDEKGGVVTIEFMFIGPLLLFWLLGSFVWYEAYRSKSLTAKTAYAIADIASRYEVASDENMEDLFEMHKELLPRRVAEGWLRISSICYNDDEASHKVLWSYLGDDTYDPDADPALLENARLVPLEDEDIPLNLLPDMADDDTVILVETNGRWVPVSLNVGLGELVWTDRLVTRPRFVQVMPYNRVLPGYADSKETLCQDAPSPAG